MYFNETFYNNANTAKSVVQNQYGISVQFDLFVVSSGTVRVWHSNTYRLENTLNYGMERVWCICGQPGSNSVALGYDEGSIIIKVYCVVVLYISQKAVSISFTFSYITFRVLRLSIAYCFL